MKTRTDFEPDLSLPASIKEFVIQQISYTTVGNQTNNPLELESLDSLMAKVYAQIESESLRLYKSNEEWAIKEYIVEHVLREPIASEDNLKVAEGLAAPVRDWQEANFDPIQNFKLKLEVARKKRGYVKEVLRVARWFVRDCGRKQRYSESDILQFLRKLADHYTKRDSKGKVILEGINNSSYVTKCNQFKRFLDSLPEDETTGRKQVIPFDLPPYPDEFNQPAFNNQDIESIIYTTIMEEKPDVVLRMALATIYGCRCGEVAQMDSSNINLEDMTVHIPTEKHGQRKPQPIPEALKPLFSVPLSKNSTQSVIRQLRRVCRKAGIPCPRGTGMHAIRRSVVTSLYGVPHLKELTIRRFMRWSVSMGMGVMPRYIKTPVEATDLEVLESHPYVRVWKELLPFIEYLPQWSKSGINVQFNTILTFF